MRNPGIEIYRILLTFGICYWHAMMNAGHSSSGFGARIAYFLSPCVVGFVIISGWYGIKLSIGKLLRLWGVAIYAVIALAIIDSLLHGYAGLMHYYNILRSNCYWFLMAYTVLMLISPAIDVLVDDFLAGPTEKRQKAKLAIGCIFALVFGWTFLTGCPYIKDFVPKSAEISHWSGLTLVGIYTAARLVRKMNIDDQLTLRMRILIAGGCGVAILAHFGPYASIFSFGWMMIGFLLFKGIKLRGGVYLFGPSMFAIYLLHCNRIGFALMEQFEDYLLSFGIDINLVFPITGLVAFLAALLLDAPRRIVVSLARKFIGIRTRNK